MHCPSSLLGRNQIIPSSCAQFPGNFWYSLNLQSMPKGRRIRWCWTVGSSQNLIILRTTGNEQVELYVVEKERIYVTSLTCLWQAFTPTMSHVQRWRSKSIDRSPILVDDSMLKLLHVQNEPSYREWQLDAVQWTRDALFSSPGNILEKLISSSRSRTISVSVSIRIIIGGGGVR